MTSLPTSPSHRPPRIARRPVPWRRLDGVVLVELAVLLAIAGVVLGLGMPLGGAVLDRGAVVAVREQSLGLVHRARTLALTGVGAAVVVVPAENVLLLTDPDGRVRGRVDAGEVRVDLRTSGTADSVRIEWNALGWGIFASRTLEFRRGAARARLVVSSRGRAERR